MQLNNGLLSNITDFIKKRLIECFGLVLITFFFLYISSNKLDDALVAELKKALNG